MEKGSHAFFEELQTAGIYEKLHRPIIIAEGLQSPENMGSILRLAGNIGALNTTFISDKAPEFRAAKIKRTASGADSKTNWQIISSLEDLRSLIPVDYRLIAIETSEKASSLYSYHFHEKIALVVGSESYGISKELLAMTEDQVFIPIPGIISSLNVTHALSIALFEWFRQMMSEKL
jgi:tRNA G18 (ribose-2'-O)-methylase SpoU